MNCIDTSICRIDALIGAKFGATASAVQFVTVAMVVLGWVRVGKIGTASPQRATAYFAIVKFAVVALLQASSHQHLRRLSKSFSSLSSCSVTPSPSIKAEHPSPQSANHPQRA
ncbi:hypothetical protein M378DRAFT_850218 [Amanita muscaria Koide BX008]|uniref:Uncharacterized protein n=1 Tax=Amanita muscaria (strain Koide BX008) TaxID=946122 RepID=A0A0C2SEV8_AMAMK|nr:hypothetical protein M378DRAFT_850218 [Amanita muscaria Koide BX008]